MIPITLFKKFGSEAFITSIKVINMTTYSSKFYVEPPWEGEMKVYIKGLGHMTKMAAMPIYGKKTLKISSPEPEVL